MSHEPVSGPVSEPIRFIRDLRHLRPTLRLWGLFDMIPRTALILAALGAIACAPQRPAPGALAPVANRGTNESRAADLAAIDAWEARRVALVRNDGPDLAVRTVALARAGAWLVFAREAYQSRPNTSDADDALTEARKLMAPFEPDAPLSAGRGTLAARADRLSAENWAEVERLASKPEAIADVALLAEAEIELVRAALPQSTLAPSVVLAGGYRDAPSSAVVLPTSVSDSSVSPLSCPAVQHIARAVALLGEADAVVQDAARQLAVVDKLQQDERVRARRVHFAVRSDVVGMPSAVLLAGVAGALKSHPELSLVIEGHADPRGGDAENRELSGRRAAMVREIMADSGVTEERMLVRQFGASRRAAAGSTAADYARDRRVVLKFVLPDGEELPIAEDTALDLQVERVVKRSAIPRNRRVPARRARVPR